MQKYSTLFFDLDGTLWDLKKNTQLTLADLWNQFDLEARWPGKFNFFFRRYTKHNDEAWALYRDNKIEKEVLRIVRFEKALADVGVSWSANEIARFADEFIERCPRQPHLLPHALDVLNACKKKYKLMMITNGFNEIQNIKMEAAGIAHFFERVVYSEDLNIKKPHPEIFHYAMDAANCLPNQGLMIGDDWDADIRGAMGVGMDQAYLATTEELLNAIRKSEGLKPLRHNHKPTYRLKSLKDLEEILLL